VTQHFDVYPKVVPKDSKVTVTILPLYDHCRFAAGRTYEVVVRSMAAGTGTSACEIDRQLLTASSGGALHVAFTTESEQEYALVVDDISGEGRTNAGEFRVYSVCEDLLLRRPYKGDLHIHSTRTDGRVCPGYVAGASRKAGLDFVAITDHHIYAPSLEAQQAFADIAHDLAIIPGEEVHPPEVRAHLVNFGGRYSVNQLFQDDQATYRAQVQAIEDGLTDPVPGVNRYEYAASRWAFEQIRASGGLGILSHPYDGFLLSEPLITQLLNDQPFDAFEVMSGFYRFETNKLQIARYHEERSRDRGIPVVCGTDAHREELIGWCYTMVLSPSLDTEDLIQSVKDLYSVAVFPSRGEVAEVYGPFRLVKFAYFLLREVMPQHDVLCAMEGQLMLDHLAGDGQAASILQARTGRVAKLYGHLWWRPPSTAALPGGTAS
jgi:predicted metal-dependent phosphoesterase TrpH